MYALAQQNIHHKHSTMVQGFTLYKPTGQITHEL